MFFLHFFQESQLIDGTYFILFLETDATVTKSITDIDFFAIFLISLAFTSHYRNFETFRLQIYNEKDLILWTH